MNVYIYLHKGEENHIRSQVLLTLKFILSFLDNYFQ